MSNALPTIHTGLRMMDVRMALAAAHGLHHVDKIDAGHYTIHTLDGGKWNVEKTPSGMWRGEQR